MRVHRSVDIVNVVVVLVVMMMSLFLMTEAESVIRCGTEDRQFVSLGEVTCSGNMISATALPQDASDPTNVDTCLELCEYTLQVSEHPGCCQLYTNQGTEQVSCKVFMGSEPGTPFLYELTANCELHGLNNADNSDDNSDETTIIIVIVVVSFVLVFGIMIFYWNYHGSKKVNVASSAVIVAQQSPQVLEVVTVDNNSSSKIKEEEEEEEEKEEDGTTHILLQSGLKLSDVDNLSALPREWRDCLMCRDIPELKTQYTEKLRALDDDIQNPSIEVSDRIDEMVSDLHPIFQTRIEMYRDSLKSFGSKPCRQVSSLLLHLESIYRKAYEGVFDLVTLKEGDALSVWTEFAKTKEISTVARQSECVLSKLYLEARNVRPVYEDFMTRMSLKTGGSYCPVRIKRVLRCVEKGAIHSHSKDKSFFKFDDENLKCDNVCDIVRGALAYDTLSNLTQGAQTILNSKEFTCMRFKDRFSRGKETCGGWRDAMITGYLEKDSKRHLVEIQLHLNSLLKLRSMGGSVGGGHQLYATYRSLEEALLIAYGQKRVTETIEKLGQTSPHPRPLPKHPHPTTTTTTTTSTGTTRTPPPPSRKSKEINLGNTL